MPSGKKKTNDEFIKDFQNKNNHYNSIELLSRYESNIKPIMCKCLICGYIWESKPKYLLNNHGCPKCSGNVQLTHKEFEERFSKQNPNYKSIIVIGKYSGMEQTIECKCKKCGAIWNPKAGSLIYKKSGCPSCSGNINYTQKKFISEFIKKNPYSDSIAVLGNYEGSLNPIKCQCKKCGTIWNPISSSLIQGTGCPNCAKIRVGQKGREVLKNIKKPTPISHKDYIEKFKMKNPYANTIEIIGKYKGSRNNIKCKCRTCGNIWNTSPSGLLNGTGCPNCSHSSTSFMEQFLYKALCSIIGNENVLLRDKKIIGKELDIVLPKNNFAVEIGSWNWHQKIYKDDINKQQICKEKGISLLIIYDSYNGEKISKDNIITYNIDIGSEKNNLTLKKIVKYILEINNIYYNNQAINWPKITKEAYLSSQKKNHDDFLNELKNNNIDYETIEILTQYTRAVDKIKCRCKECGNIWYAIAGELLRGSGCPKCKIKRVGECKRKKNIILYWRSKNPQGNKSQCERDTGISRVTINKWWNS